MIDEKLIHKKVDNDQVEKNGYDFIQANNKEIDNEMDGENDKYSLAIDEFIDINGKNVNPVNLPYETIDVLFIYINNN